MTCITLGVLFAVLFLFFFGKLTTGSNRNPFSIVAALLCLPVGLFAVNLMMLIKARPCSEEAYRAISAHDARLYLLYDLYMTSPKDNYSFACACVLPDRILLYTEDPALKIAEAAKHIRLQIALSKYHDIEILIEKDLSRFTQLLEESEDLVVAQGLDLFAAEEAWQPGTRQTMAGVLKSISL